MKHCNKGVKNLPSLKTENAVYFQLVPNMRKWIPGIVTERVSVQSYRVKAIKGGVYIRNRKFIRIKHTDSRQSLQTTEENMTSSYSNTHRGRPKQITRRPQRLIKSMNFIKTWNTQRRFA